MEKKLAVQYQCEKCNGKFTVHYKPKLIWMCPVCGERVCFDEPELNEQYAALSPEASTVAPEETKVVSEKPSKDNAVKAAANSALKGLMSEGFDLVQKRRKMEKEQEALEARFKELEKEEVQFATTLGDIGFMSLKLQDGSLLEVKEEYHCSINKNIADKSTVAEWLEDNGGEDFIEEVMEVPSRYKAALDKTGIKYANICNFNTLKVKSWLLEKLGLKAGSVQDIELADLPKGLHFHVSSKLVVK